MAKNIPKPGRARTAADRWGFFGGIVSLLSAFPHATTSQKAAIVAMCLGVVMFIGLGLVTSVTLPAWAVVSMFLVATVFVFGIAGTLIYVEREKISPFRCRHVPVFPLDTKTRKGIAAGLEEIRKDVSEQLRTKYSAMPDSDVRANIFLLAQIIGGAADGTWKLVIDSDLAINMNHPPELQLQFNVGQGATGVAYRDGTYQLTRRLAAPKKGEWERKFQMTPTISGQIHNRLKWIVSFPLLRPNASEAVGVLNIDGLIDAPDDDMLNEVASSVQKKVEVIAKNVSLQPSICVGLDRLGVMEHD